MSNEAKIEAGRRAVAVEGIVGPLIQDRIPAIIDRMVNLYRSGKLEHDRLIGCVAEITAYYNLMSDLEAVQRQAITAAQKEFGNAAEEERE